MLKINKDFDTNAPLIIHIRETIHADDTLPIIEVIKDPKIEIINTNLANYWCYSFNNSDFYNSTFSSRELALAACLDEAVQLNNASNNGNAHESGYVAHEFGYIAQCCIPKNKDLFPLAGLIIESMEQEAFNTYGEHSDKHPCGTFPQVSKVELDDLTMQLHELLNRWCDQYNILPSFYITGKSEKILLEPLVTKSKHTVITFSLKWRDAYPYPAQVDHFLGDEIEILCFPNDTVQFANNLAYRHTLMYPQVVYSPRLNESELEDFCKANLAHYKAFYYDNFDDIHACNPLPPIDLFWHPKEHFAQVKSDESDLMALHKEQVEKPIQDFNNFKAELIRIANQLFTETDRIGFDRIEFDEGIHQNGVHQGQPYIFFFAFWSDEEDKVDLFMRTVRNELLSITELKEQHDSNVFIYEVCKSCDQVEPFDPWSIEFTLASKYKCTEIYGS